MSTTSPSLRTHRTVVARADELVNVRAEGAPPRARASHGAAGELLRDPTKHAGNPRASCCRRRRRRVTSSFKSDCRAGRSRRRCSIQSRGRIAACGPCYYDNRTRPQRHCLSSLLTTQPFCPARPCASLFRLAGLVRVEGHAAQSARALGRQRRPRPHLERRAFPLRGWFRSSTTPSCCPAMATQIALVRSGSCTICPGCTRLELRHLLRLAGNFCAASDDCRCTHRSRQLERLRFSPTSI